MSKIYVVIFLLISPLARAVEKEVFYAKKFCSFVAGKIESKNMDGTLIDCETSDYVFEVDFAQKWYEAIGQSLHYSVQKNKKPGILLILKYAKDFQYLPRVCAVNKKFELKIRVMVMNSNGIIVNDRLCSE